MCGQVERWLDLLSVGVGMWYGADIGHEGTAPPAAAVLDFPAGTPATAAEVAAPILKLWVLKRCGW